MNDIKWIQESLKCTLETAQAIEAVMYDYLNAPDYSESSLRKLKRDFLMVAELANIEVK
jgi:hypothetical protein